MAELPEGGQSSLYEKKYGRFSLILGGLGGPAQYEMLNFKLVLLKNIEVQSFFLKWEMAKP